METIGQDTSPEAQRALFDLTRATPVWKRLKLTCELIHTTRLLMLADLRRRFPQAGEEELRRRLIARMLTREEVELAFGFDPAKEGYFYVATAEDSILAKLLGYRRGGEVSRVQWADVLGVIGTQGSALDVEYLKVWADKLGVSDLLGKVLSS